MPGWDSYATIQLVIFFLFKAPKCANTFLDNVHLQKIAELSGPYGEPFRKRISCLFLALQIWNCRHGTWNANATIGTTGLLKQVSRCSECAGGSPSPLRCTLLGGRMKKVWTSSPSMWKQVHALWLSEWGGGQMLKPAIERRWGFRPFPRRANIAFEKPYVISINTYFPMTPLLIH